MTELEYLKIKDLLREYKLYHGQIMTKVIELACDVLDLKEKMKEIKHERLRK